MKRKKIIIVTMIILFFIGIFLFVMSYVYEDKFIDDSLTGYACTYHRKIFWIPLTPELTLVFGEDEIIFEVPFEHHINNSFYFNGMTIEEFKDKDVVVSYRENCYGHKIICDLNIWKKIEL